MKNSLGYAIELCNIMDLRNRRRGRNRLRKGLAAARLFDKNYAISLASKLNVDYIFLGRVTEYNYQYGLREDPAVGLSVKLIDTKGQEVIWSADEGRVNRSFIFRDSLAATAIETVKSVLSDLK